MIQKDYYKEENESKKKEKSLCFLQTILEETNFNTSEIQMKEQLLVVVNYKFHVNYHTNVV